MGESIIKRVKRLIPRGQRGAVSIEYVGLAAVVVAIIAGLYMGIATGGVGDAMSGVLGRVAISFDGGDTGGGGPSGLGRTQSGVKAPNISSGIDGEESPHGNSSQQVGDSDQGLLRTLSGLPAYVFDSLKRLFAGFTESPTLDVPKRYQGKLGDGWGCAPACLGMAMDFFHSQDDQNPTYGTQQIIDHMNESGLFRYKKDPQTAQRGQGTTASELAQAARDLGYENSQDFSGWTKDDLQKAIASGHVVIAGIRMPVAGEGISGKGDGHAVVVTGISEDGSSVFVNDPKLGPKKYSWDQFRTFWNNLEPSGQGCEVIP